MTDRPVPDVSIATMPPLVRSLRPRQWLKNLLVFAAPAAAGVLDEWDELRVTLLMFVAFCAASSATYLWNDLADRDADRRHPVKRRRPIAAGTVSRGAAVTAAIALMVAAFGLAALTGRWEAVGVLALYLAVTLTYTVIWKHIAVLDIVAIAAGFVLRAAAGAAAADVAMSSWFVLVTTFGSLFVVTGKRLAELRELETDARSVRATLGDYSEGYLRFVLGVSAAGAIVSYCVWAFETKELAGSDGWFYELSIVPVVTAFLRYALVIEHGDGGAPEDVFTSDRVLQALCLVWLIVFGVAVYA